MTPLSEPVPLAAADHSQVLTLFKTSPRHHLHLDWHSLEQWLPDPALRCWLVRKNGLVQSLIGATVHFPPPGAGHPAAWVRFIQPAGVASFDPALDDLWEAVRADLCRLDVRQAAILSLEYWVDGLAGRWGFEPRYSVVTLRREGGPIPPKPAPPLAIREVAATADLDMAASIDAAAFEPLWQYDRATLAIAQQHAASFTLLEREGLPVGYQLSTRNLGDGHLARLAILPEEQGKGLGGLLIGEVLRFFQELRVETITVNTQSDNVRSQRLYTKLGFEVIGQGVPVWTLDL